MNGEHRIPPWLLAAIVFVIMAVGVAAYYAGRFGRSSRLQPPANADLPGPGAPAPAVAGMLSTPAEIPPTITPPIPVVVERGSRASGVSAGVMVERSSQIEVPLRPAIPTGMPAAMPIRLETTPTPRPRIAIEISAPRPTPTPTIPELERPEEPPPDETPEPPPEETPEPEPTVRPRGAPAAQ